MADVTAFAKLGKDFGLAGSELLSWVNGQMDIAQRNREQERQQLDKEREERALVRAHEKELAQQKHELEVLKVTQAHELAMAQAVNTRSDVDNDNKVYSVAPSPIKLPVYKDGEDFSAFLSQFEAICELACFAVESYPVRLGSVLSGRPLEIFISLDIETRSDYDSLKSALLLSLRKNVSQYRSDFRSAKRMEDESFQQFSIRLARLLNYWLQSAKVDKNKSESLTEFVLYDQFLCSLEPDLCTHLREQGVLKLSKAVECADSWLSAHPECSNYMNSTSNVPSGNSRVFVSCTETGTKPKLTEQKNVL